MKKYLHFPFLLCFFLMCFGIQQSKATHIMGMDVSWKYFGNDTFQIKLVVYRRCTDGAAPLNLPATPPTLTSDSCANAYTVGLGTTISYTVDDITPLCAATQKPCPISGGSGVGTSLVPNGVERHTVLYKVYLGGIYANCCWYKVRWQLCCRNSNITTGYADADFYSESWLNRCVKNGDNGPEFNNPPLIMGCANQDICYNNAVRDADGDSLSYQMAAPLGGSYASPWSTNYPLTCLGGNNPNPNANPPTGFNLDVRTGDICFRPVQVQISVFKIMVTEWRKDSNGVYAIIGKTARDMQFGCVQGCTNKLPALSGPFTYDACAGQQLCFTINTNDQDVTDSTKIYWNGGLKNGIWTDNNGTVKAGSGTLCWTPGINDWSNLPYYFIATVFDDHCPLFGRTTRAYSINVKRSPENTRTYTRLSCSLFEFKAVPANSYSSSATNTWYVPVLVGNGSPSVILQQTPICQYPFTQSGKYLVKNTLSLNGCTITAFDTVTIDSIVPSHIICAGDTIICPGNSVDLISDSALNYQWYNDTTLITGATSRIYNASKAGKYYVKTLNNNCLLKSNSITLFEIAKPQINKSTPVCIGDTFVYNTAAKSGATYQWYKNGLPIAGAQNNFLKITQAGIYYCKVIQLPCTLQSNTDTAIFLPLPAKPVITMNGITLFSSAAASYQWYNDTIRINGATGIYHIPNTSGNYRVKITGSNGCSVFSDPFIFNVGIKNNPLAIKVNISPNPFHDQLKIQFNDVINPVSVVLYDMNGRSVLESVSSRNIMELNTTKMSAGLYLLEISEGENKVFVRVEKR